MYHDFAVKNNGLELKDYLTAARKAASRAGNGPMMEDVGLIEKENGNFSSAARDLERARALYSTPDDLLRAVLEEAGALIKAGNKNAALALVRRVARLAPDTPATTLLKKIEQQLNPPSPSPKTAP
jgi:tetratricopeptide (TPR) repeat protein